MSLVGVFTQSRPQIQGLFFDAIITEATEMTTDVTEYPVETGAIGNDHAVQRPLRITMRVGVSDNPARALAAAASDVVGSSAGAVTRAIAGTSVGAAVGQLSGAGASGAGLSASVLNAAFAAGQASTRSQTVLEQIRALQRANTIVNVVGAKGREYKNCMITSTRQETNKENEQGLELVVELQQLLLVATSPRQSEVLPAGDSAETQGQRLRDFGRVSLE